MVSPSFELPECDPDFSHINRYWDKDWRMPVAKLTPGEFYVTAADEAVTTVLGNAVSLCLRDPLTGIGGLNYYLAPQPPAATNHIDENLQAFVDAVYKHCDRSTILQATLVGGANSDSATAHPGEMNLEQVRAFCLSLGLNFIEEETGGTYPRKLTFHPGSGRLLIKKLYNKHNSSLQTREAAYTGKAKSGNVTGP